MHHRHETGHTGSCENMSDLRTATLLLTVSVSVGALGLLTSCANPGAPRADVSGPEQSRNLVDQAGLAFQAGNTAEALALLQQAAKSDPESPEPWLRLAQVHFDGERFAAAIIAAHEVLARNPEQRTAQSVAAVSALRIARDQLTSLRAGASLHGSVREEAQMLTNEMRQTLNKKLLVPRSEPAIHMPPRRRSLESRPSRKRGDTIVRSRVDRGKATTEPRSTRAAGDPFNPFETLQSLPQ